MTASRSRLMCAHTEDVRADRVKHGPVASVTNFAHAENEQHEEHEAREEHRGETADRGQRRLAQRPTARYPAHAHEQDPEVSASPRPPPVEETDRSGSARPRMTSVKEHGRAPHRDVRRQGCGVLRQHDRRARDGRRHSEVSIVPPSSTLFGEEAHRHRRHQYEENHVEEDGVPEERRERGLVAAELGRVVRELIDQQVKVHPLREEEATTMSTQARGVTKKAKSSRL